MSNSRLDPTATDKWESAHCPMPDCGADLYLVRTENIPIYRVSIAEDLKPGKGITTGWEVVCTEGHTLLLPGDEHPEDADFVDHCEACEESGTFHNDLVRLGDVLEMRVITSRMREQLGWSQ
jgi:hypothetical protein